MNNIIAFFSNLRSVNFMSLWISMVAIFTIACFVAFKYINRANLRLIILYTGYAVIKILNFLLAFFMFVETAFALSTLYRIYNHDYSINLLDFLTAINLIHMSIVQVYILHKMYLDIMENSITWREFNIMEDKVTYFKYDADDMYILSDVCLLGELLVVCTLNIFHMYMPNIFSIASSYDNINFAYGVHLMTVLIAFTCFIFNKKKDDLNIYRFVCVLINISMLGGMI